MGDIYRVQVEADTQRKVAAAWRQLYEESNRLWQDAEAKLNIVRGVLGHNGCDCECGHDAEGHDPECELCLACNIGRVVASG